MNILDYQSQVWFVVVGIWAIGFAAFALTFIGCAVAMFWQENREAIKGNLSVVLNVAGLLAILLVEAGWQGLLRLWEHSVPSDRTQWNIAANALHFDGYSEDEIIAQIGECPKDE